MPTYSDSSQDSLPADSIAELSRIASYYFRQGDQKRADEIGHLIKWISRSREIEAMRQQDSVTALFGQSQDLKRSDRHLTAS